MPHHGFPTTDPCHDQTTGRTGVALQSLLRLNVCAVEALARLSVSSVGGMLCGEQALRAVQVHFEELPNNGSVKRLQPRGTRLVALLNGQP